MEEEVLDGMKDYQKKFVKEPLEFIKKHNVLAPGGDPCKTSNLGTVFINVKKDENVKHMYNIVFTDDPNSLRVYWCGFAMNGCGSVVLGKQAEYIFTARMSGCSFGVGVRKDASKEGSMEICVVHSNRANLAKVTTISEKSVLNGHKKQWKGQRDLINCILGTNKKNRVIDSRSGVVRLDKIVDCKMTTFGVWVEHVKNWQFYGKIIWKSGKNTCKSVWVVTDEKNWEGEWDNICN